MLTKIWYSVENCGDGSAYPQLMESEALAQFDQDNMDEGWGESCIGSITIEHDSPITVKNNITTIDDRIKELEEELTYDYIKDWRKEDYTKQINELKEMKGEQR